MGKKKSPAHKARTRKAGAAPAKSSGPLPRMRVDDYVTFASFGREILVECPECDDCATIRQIDILPTDRLQRIAKASCLHCGKQSQFPYPYNAWKTLPLWLKTRCHGNSLWASNEKHLAWLEEFIGAGLREDKLACATTRNSLHAILPRWMTAAKNRDDVAKSLRRLRAKLSQTAGRSS